MQNDRHRQFLFITCIGFVKLHKLDRPVCRTREIVQHHVKIGVVFFQHRKPGVKPWIGRRKFGEVTVIFQPWWPCRLPTSKPP